MSVEKCDHTSVGMLVYKGAKLLLIERRNPPFGFAPPAGHVDGDISFEDAARRELKEEVGLNTTHISLIAEGRRENPCKRVDGTWHYWKIYEVKAAGEIQRSLEATKQAHWFDPAHIELFAQRSKRYLAGGTTEHDWKLAPGIELVWYEIFTEFGVIN